MCLIPISIKDINIIDNHISPSVSSLKIVSDKKETNLQVFNLKIYPIEKHDEENDLMFIEKVVSFEMANFRVFYQEDNSIEIKIYTPKGNFKLGYFEINEKVNITVSNISLVEFLVNESRGGYIESIK
ncbi:hypothetical protein WAF17_21115 [Bernardetia sp. ABR2-2B]|uniref:hypothetical protein n=1 Tax=Bernardetia sp. ABR2-2B TaxID=3127472 RepID=UPI0030D13DB5